ncbi:MAG: hypothetical protein HOV81_01990, partial [Kofleriaceae bacterium]|nr:hypothetical protein [Kofleriaceae bacterium]
TARSKTPTTKGNPPGPTLDLDEEDIDPTEIDAGHFGHEATPAKPAFKAISMKTPSNGTGGIKAISMKTPGDAPKREVKAPVLPAVKLRAMSEVTRAQTPQNLGNFAPPYDPRAARAKSTREYILWGCLAVIIASAIAVVVWFVAR